MTTFRIGDTIKVSRPSHPADLAHTYKVVDIMGGGLFVQVESGFRMIDPKDTALLIEIVPASIPFQAPPERARR